MRKQLIIITLMAAVALLCSPRATQRQMDINRIHTVASTKTPVTEKPGANWFEEQVNEN